MSSPAKKASSILRKISLFSEKERKKKKEKRKKFQRNSEEKFSKGSVTVFGSRKKEEGGRGRGIPWKVKRKLKMVLARRESVAL